MEFTAIDCAIAAVTLFCAVAGLFIGFSGGLSFLAGALAAGIAAEFAFSASEALFTTVWQRTVAVIVVLLVVFGVVRWIVRKFVRKAVAQPGDAVLGSVVLAAVGFSAAVGAAWVVDSLFGGEPAFKSVVLERVVSVAGSVR